MLINQLRGIARKMVRIVRERNERSLTDTGLPFLFESTCSSIFARLEDLAEARAVSRVRLIIKLRELFDSLIYSKQKRERSGHLLRCSVELLLALVRLNAAEDRYEALRSAIGFEASDRTVGKAEFSLTDFIICRVVIVTSSNWERIGRRSRTRGWPRC